MFTRAILKLDSSLSDVCKSRGCMMLYYQPHPEECGDSPGRRESEG